VQERLLRVVERVATGVVDDGSEQKLPGSSALT
jgi:hypothetical protein